MEKLATLNLQVNPTLKQNAESILDRLGIPLSAAVDMFLNQIVLRDGLPFAISLPKVPSNMDATNMSAEQIHIKIQQGYNSYLSGRTQNAAKAFADFRENHN